MVFLESNSGLGGRMEVSHVTYQTDAEGLRTEYDICVPGELQTSAYKTDTISAHETNELKQRMDQFLREYEETQAEIERLTNHADGVDYATAVISGIVTGLIDVFVQISFDSKLKLSISPDKKWDFEKAKAISNREINERITRFAKKVGLEDWAKKNNRDPNRLETAVEFLESKFPLPGDGAYRNFMDKGITHKTHHLDDFCHHPTLVGLVSCIVVQFTGNAAYWPSSNVKIRTAIEVNQYGNLVSDNPLGKVFSGIVNWFFNVAQTIKNRRGHLFSDMSGSINSVKKGNDGMGLPGTFLSIAKELSTLPCFSKTSFAEDLRKAYQNGIGDGNKQLDLGAINSLFTGASSKLDLRTERAIGHELKQQAIPVMLNEVIVRGVYFIRQFIRQMKQTRSLAKLDWKALILVRNRTIVRMLTISTGVLTAIDLAHATIKSLPEGPGFMAAFVLRVNFVGIGRFAVALSSDVFMGISKSRLEVAMASAEVANAAAQTTMTIERLERRQSVTDREFERLSKEIDDLSDLQF